MNETQGGTEGGGTRWNDGKQQLADRVSKNVWRIIIAEFRRLT